MWPKKSCVARGVHKRTGYLAGLLLIAQIAACTIFCLSPDWLWKMFTCDRYDAATWDHLDQDGQPVCLPYPSECSPMQMSICLDMLVTNLILTLYWFIGEELCYAFNYEVDTEIWEGRQWQKTLDERNTQVRFVRIKTAAYPSCPPARPYGRCEFCVGRLRRCRAIFSWSLACSVVCV